MLKELMKCIREYKKPSILAPVLVSLEVVMECTIPFLIAMLVNQIKAGAEFSVLVKYGLLLIVMATLSLMFGIGAGNACATASCGFAKNVRKDLYAKVFKFLTGNTSDHGCYQRAERLYDDRAYRSAVSADVSFCVCHGIYHGWKDGVYLSSGSTGIGIWTLYGDPYGDAVIP